MIKKFDVNDLDKCAKIMMLVYNNEYWQCQWSLETAKAYLMDYVEGKNLLVIHCG